MAGAASAARRGCARLGVQLVFWQIALGEGGARGASALPRAPCDAHPRDRPCPSSGRLFAALGDGLTPGGGRRTLARSCPNCWQTMVRTDVERAERVAGQFAHGAGIAVVAYPLVRCRTEMPSAAGADDDAAELMGASLRLTLWSAILPRFHLDHALPQVVGPCRLVAPLDELTGRRLNRAMATPWRELAWEPHAAGSRRWCPW